MNNIDNLITSHFLHFATEENELLKRHFNKGIFDVPELMLNYEVGKRIALDPSKILGDKAYEWIREANLTKDSGISDIMFIKKNSKDSKNIVIEVKMDDTWMKYERDIRKLLNLKGAEYSRYFISFKHVLHDDQGEGFVKKLKDEFDEKADLLISNSFDVVVNEKNQRCLFTGWKLIG